MQEIKGRMQSMAQYQGTIRSTVEMKSMPTTCMGGGWSSPQWNFYLLTLGDERIILQGERR